MKAFKVYWKENISPEKEPPCMTAIVAARNIEEALAIAKSYGEVSSVFTESDRVIMDFKPAEVEMSNRAQGSPGFCSCSECETIRKQRNITEGR